jgi:methionine synthase I (cobalamin-dependent)
MSYRDILARMTGGGTILLDGATGTELERRGVPMDSAAWCGPCNLEHADVVEAVHADYIAAGASLITANTYAASRLMLEPAGLADRLDAVVANACDAAKRARDRAAGGRDVLIAGSLSHMVPLAAGSDSVDPAGEPPLDRVGDALAELAGLLVRHGCDLILLEMMYDARRTPLALRAAADSGLPVWCGFSLRRAAPDAPIYGFGRLHDVPQDDLYAMLADAGVDVAGVMHTEAGVTGPALERLAQMFPGPLMAYPDSGHFEMPNWNFKDVMSEADLVAYAQQWTGQGVRAVGGCCGLGIEHIRALHAAGIA